MKVLGDNLGEVNFASFDTYSELVPVCEGKS